MALPLHTHSHCAEKRGRGSVWSRGERNGAETDCELIAEEKSGIEVACEDASEKRPTKTQRRTGLFNNGPSQELGGGAIWHREAEAQIVPNCALGLESGVLIRHNGNYRRTLIKDSQSVSNPKRLGNEIRLFYVPGPCRGSGFRRPLDMEWGAPPRPVTANRGRIAFNI